MTKEERQQILTDCIEADMSLSDINKYLDHYVAANNSNQKVLTPLQFITKKEIVEELEKENMNKDFTEDEINDYAKDQFPGEDKRVPERKRGF